MPIRNSREMLAPVTSKQTTLKCFFPQLPDPPVPDLLYELDARRRVSKTGPYRLELRPGNTIEIVNTHCLACRHRLVHNGFNDRWVVVPSGGRWRVRLHRKRCEKCDAEIPMDLGQLAPRGKTYHENFPRGARQLYLADQMPRQIQDAFRVLWDVEVPASTITGWIQDAAEPLRELHATTALPSSGTWHYDEIYLRVAGERKYALYPRDANTGFIMAAHVRDHMGRADGREVLLAAKHGRASRGGSKLDCLVMDGTTNLGGLLHTRNFKGTAVQRCKTHFKWTASKHVKALAGMATGTRKPLPERWRPVLQRVYRVLEATNETEFFSALAALAPVLDRPWPKPRAEDFKKFFRSLVASKEKILAWTRDPRVPATNNAIENTHQTLEAYPSFKRRMMTPDGAQRVLDFRAFGYNRRLFSREITRLEARLQQLDDFSTRNLWDPSLNGSHRHFRVELRNACNAREKYEDVWSRYFAKI